MDFSFFASHLPATRDYVISIAYSSQILRKISKNWEVLARLNKSDFSQIGKFELSYLFRRARTSQFFEIFLSIPKP